MKLTFINEKIKKIIQTNFFQVAYNYEIFLTLKTAQQKI